MYFHTISCIADFCYLIRHGAEEVSESNRGTARNKPSHFVGTGYRLGESESEASSTVAGASRPKPPVSCLLSISHLSQTPDAVWELYSMALSQLISTVDISVDINSGYLS